MRPPPLSRSDKPLSPAPPSEQRPLYSNLVMTADDREFLPAALEILETPPSPVRMTLIKVMAAFVAVALAWAFFGRLDVIAVAQGKIQPPGRVKIVQPTETGRVVKIGIENGQAVSEGVVLIELDPTDARADLEALEATLASLQAETLRRDTAIRAIQGGRPTAAPPGIKGMEAVPAAIRQRENEVLAADLRHLAASIGALDSQAEQKRREVKRLAATIAAQTTLAGTLRERVTMRDTLANRGFGTRASLIDSKEALQKEETALATYIGQLAEAEAALDVLASERSRALQAFQADNTQKRAEAERNLDEARQRRAKAAKRLETLSIRAPAAGTVQALSVYTMGQVVSAGQELMRIVPESATMEVEAYLPNKDIGFVREGQEVSLKIDSFPYTRYGILSGRVVRVARDAVPQPEAAQIESSATRPGEPPPPGGAQRTQNLVFPVTIQLTRKTLVIDGASVSLSPGMTVVAEIKTGSRRILEYIFSPVYEVTSEAMRER